MKTLKLKTILLGLTAVLAVAFTMTSCQQDSIISPIEIQDETTELRTGDAPDVSEIDFNVRATRIYVYAFDFNGINHEFQWRIPGETGWNSLGETTKYHSAIKNTLACTVYEVQLQVECPDGTMSGWSDSVFITSAGDCDCPAPETGDIIFEEHSTTLYLYPADYQVVNHEFEVSFNEGPFVSLGVRNSHYSAITNKQCGPYEIRLSVQCDDGNWSNDATVTYETCGD